MPEAGRKGVSIELFIFAYVGSSLLCAGFSLAAVSRVYPLVVVCGLIVAVGLSCCRAWVLGTWASVVVAWVLAAVWYVGS